MEDTLLAGMLAGGEPWAEQCSASSQCIFGTMLLHVLVLASLGIWDAGHSPASRLVPAPGWKNEPKQSLIMNSHIYREGILHSNSLSR